MALFKEFKDVIAWSYKDMMGIPPNLCQHRIYLEDNTKPICQSPYRINPKYSLKVKQEIDKLLDAGVIYPINNSEWVSPIVIVLKKNDEIRICVWIIESSMLGLRKIIFHFHLLTLCLIMWLVNNFIHFLMDLVATIKSVFTLMINQYFCSTYAYRVMPFGLCNALATFQLVVTQDFRDFLRDFMEIFLDDFWGDS